MMNPSIPLRLTLVALLAGSPLPKAWFSVTLSMKTKNPYRLLLGPASPEGVLVATRDDVLREIKKVRDLFLMDYDDPTIAWTGRLEVRVLSRSDIANLLLAYDTYGSTGVYPPDLPQQLMDLDGKLDSHEDDDVSAQISVEGGEGIQVVSVSQKAG